MHISMASYPSLLLLVLLSSLLGLGISDVASDQAECESQLLVMATCLAYVHGDSKAPTPDCCEGLKQVVGKSFKCLCVLIKDRDSPELGLNVNVNLALTLPSKCNSPANVTDCPRLLGLPLNSTDAKVFSQFGKQLQEGGTGNNDTSAGAHGNPNSTGNKEAGKQTNGLMRMRWLGMEMGVGKWIMSLLLIPIGLVMLGV